MKYTLVHQRQLMQVEELWDYCFEKREEPFFQYYFEYYCGKENQVLCGFDKLPATSGRLQTMVHINPFQLDIRGGRFFVPYLVGIATAPEARGQHLLRPLLQEAFKRLRKQNCFMVTLMPIAACIYEPYEFAFCYYRQEYDTGLDELVVPTLPEQLRVEQLALDALKLEELYRRFTSGWNGVPDRGDQWKKLLAVHELEGSRLAVVYRAEEPCGYMLYSVTGGTFEIIELLTSDINARLRLLQYAAAHKSECQKLHWLAEPWDLTYLRLSGQKPALRPFIMARCIDAELALRSLATVPKELQGRVVLELTDGLVPANNCRLAVSVEQGTLKVEQLQKAKNANSKAAGKAAGKAAEDTADLTMGIAAFTQLYMGAFTAEELLAAGLLEYKKPAIIPFVQELFPKCKNYNNEYY